MRRAHLLIHDQNVRLTRIDRLYTFTFGGACPSPMRLVPCVRASCVWTSTDRLWHVYAGRVWNGQVDAGSGSREGAASPVYRWGRLASGGQRGEDGARGAARG